MSFPLGLQDKLQGTSFSLYWNEVWCNKDREKDGRIRKSYCPIYFWYCILNKIKRWLSASSPVTVSAKIAPKHCRGGRVLMVVPALLSHYTSCTAEPDISYGRSLSTNEQLFLQYLFQSLQLKNEIPPPGGLFLVVFCFKSNRNLHLDCVSSIPHISILKVLILSFCCWLHPNICIDIFAFTLSQAILYIGFSFILIAMNFSESF